MVFDVGQTSPGDVVSMVVAILCYDKGTALVQTSDKKCQRMLVMGLDTQDTQVALLDVVVEATHPLPCVKVVEGSRVAPFDAVKKHQLFQVADLCSGTGGFSMEWASIGFDVKLAVDQNERWEELYRRLHPSSSVEYLQGDAGSSQAVRRMHDLGLTRSVVLAESAASHGHDLGIIEV